MDLEAVSGGTALGIVLCHLLGDYVLQSDWMAIEKTKRWFPAVLHGVMYTLPFLLLTTSWLALLVIGGTHIVIDRYRLARHVGYAKNFLAPRSYWHKWGDCSVTGYPRTREVWLTVWLMIIVDNTLHLCINFASLVLLT